MTEIGFKQHGLVWALQLHTRTEYIDNEDALLSYLHLIEVNTIGRETLYKQHISTH